MSLVEVRDLRVSFGRHRRVAVDGIDLTLAPGERLGLIGESGSGKSVTALAILGLLPETAHCEGQVSLAGTDMIRTDERTRSGLRGDVASMIFQEPMTALDPTMRAGRQVAEVLRLHHRTGRHDARERVIAMLGRVGLSDPARIADSYPHQLSGGQRQRVAIAMALINAPDLVICDEPTTALDVTVQARVLRVLDEQLSDAGAACLFISHDLAVVSQMCQQIAVMLDGRIVESGPLARVLSAPEHPYTQGLIATSRIEEVPRGERLPTVEDYWQGDGDE